MGFRRWQTLKGLKSTYVTLLEPYDNFVCHGLWSSFALIAWSSRHSANSIFVPFKKLSILVELFLMHTHACTHTKLYVQYVCVDSHKLYLYLVSYTVYSLIESRSVCVIFCNCLSCFRIVTSLWDYRYEWDAQHIYTFFKSTNQNNTVLSEV